MNEPVQVAAWGGDSALPSDSKLAETTTTTTTRRTNHKTVRPTEHPSYGRSDDNVVIMTMTMMVVTAMMVT